MSELSRGEVPRAAELCRLEHEGSDTLDWLRSDDSLDARKSCSPYDLGPEREHTMVRCDYRRSIDGRQTGGSVYRSPQRILPSTFGPFLGIGLHQFRKR